VETARTPEIESSGLDALSALDGPVAVIAPTALESLTRGEIDIQVSTAKKYPRSLTRFLHEAETLACVDEETAASCFYVLKRSGKTIEGPSVRLAEIVAYAWGNLRTGARPIADDGKMLTAQGYAHDLERNVARVAEVKRRVTDRDGRRYSEDMVAVTSNAACSIAGRNAIFQTIPRAYVDRILKRAKRVAVGDASSLAQRRDSALDYFAKMGVERERVLAVLERASVEEVTLEDLETLTGLKTAIKDGMTTVDEAFPMPGAKTAAEPETGSRAAALAGKLKRGKDKAAPAAAETEREPGED
jgi:hypothetical protein